MRGNAATQSQGGTHTQILHILVGGQREDAALLSCPHAGAVRLVDDNAVCDAGREEGDAVGEASPSRVVVEGDVAQAVPQRSEQQRNVSREPRELQRLRKLCKALAQRLVGGRRRGHCEIWRLSCGLRNYVMGPLGVSVGLCR